jgi:hypothetical protein
MGIAPQPRQGVAGQGVAPGAGAGLPAEAGQAAPEILRELGEGVGAVGLAAGDRDQVLEELAAVALDDHGGGAPPVAGGAGRLDRRLGVFVGGDVGHALPS